jgi:hypothetical protein
MELRAAEALGFASGYALDQAAVGKPEFMQGFIVVGYQD